MTGRAVAGVLVAVVEAGGLGGLAKLPAVCLGRPQTQGPLALRRLRLQRPMDVKCRTEVSWNTPIDSSCVRVQQGRFGTQSLTMKASPDHPLIISPCIESNGHLRVCSRRCRSWLRSRPAGSGTTPGKTCRGPLERPAPRLPCNPRSRHPSICRARKAPSIKIQINDVAVSEWVLTSSVETPPPRSSRGSPPHCTHPPAARRTPPGPRPHCSWQRRRTVDGSLVGVVEGDQLATLALALALAHHATRGQRQDDEG